MIHPIMFLDRDNKTKLVPAFFFLLFRTLIREKFILGKKCVIVTTVIISLRSKETNYTALFTLLLQKVFEKSN